ncbi:hypothetical protein COOONC_04314, partial [Cooperia oncophora]
LVLRWQCRNSEQFGGWTRQYDGKKIISKLVYDEIRCRDSHYQPPVSFMDFVAIRKVTKCDKSGYLLQAPANHSTFATTNPGVYEYIPTVIHRLKRRSCELYEANFALVIRTKDTVSILKWLILCALEKDCMAPPGSQLSCKFSGDRFTQYAHCVYEYIPTVIHRLKRRSCELYEANFALVIRTKDTVSILKWLILCALEKDCMAPPGSQLSCKFSGDRFTQYAHCHR